MSKMTDTLEDAYFDAFNEGRDAEADFSGMTYGVWSAVLDERACGFCDWANNRTFTLETAHPVPPVHFGCRCVIVYYTEDMLVEDGFEIDELFDEWDTPPDSVMPPGTKGRL